MQKGQHILAEIRNQPQAWAETIRIVEAAAGPLRDLLAGVDEVIFTGCGSALNASHAMAPTFQHFTGTRARAVPAAEIDFFPETVFAGEGRYLVVAISRSGSTSETVLACDRALNRGMKTLAITCRAESPLARKANQALVLAPANEVSVTTTQSLSSMILAGQVLSAIAAQNSDYLAQLRSLPECGRRILAASHDLGRTIAENESINKFAFVGCGALLGLAREAQLKVKEMVLVPSDAYPLLDYRHGPKSNVDEHMLVTVLMTDRTREVEIEFLQEMKGLGGKLFALCERADEEVRKYADYLAEIKSGLPDFARDILYLPAIQFLACYKSLSRGLDPENPVNLTYWVETAHL